jgi:hypothetical protein
VCDGDSGTWVVHSNSPEVYGHVVATDLFGDAYVVPMLDTFDDIRKHLGADYVGLPKAGDFPVRLCDQALTADGSVTAPPCQLVRIEDVGSETSESTIVADSIASLTEKSIAFSEVPWIATPHQLSHMIEVGGRTNSSRVSDEWNHGYANLIAPHRPEKQEAIEPKSSEQNSSGRIPSKRKSSKQKSHEQKTRAEKFIEQESNEQRSNTHRSTKKKKKRLSVPEQDDSTSTETAERRADHIAGGKGCRPVSWKNIFAKEWPRFLATAGAAPIEQEPYIHQMRQLNTSGNGISLFFHGLEDSALSKVDEVEEFCNDAGIENLLLGRGVAGNSRVAWLDDRSFGSNSGVRRYQNPLTATLLYQFLKQPVGHIITHG